MRKITFSAALEMCREYISDNFSHLLSEEKNLCQLKSYIEKYIHSGSIFVEGYTEEELRDAIYREMAEYSILTPYLKRDDIEEINVNSWSDIAVTYSDGRIEKIRERFSSPSHAIDIIKRLLHNSGMIIDNATPLSQGHLPGNNRITAIKEPVVDPEAGISVSIRILHREKMDTEDLIAKGCSNRKMMEFLKTCLRFGVSFVIAGATSSGKTTLLNALLADIEDDKRIFTIESGARELSLIRYDDEGNITNNVVHTLSRPNENKSYNVSQEDLVVASLRFNPDVVVVGEMRDTEAYSAVEASMTGHTVVSTIHSYSSSAAHTRLALLTQKRFPIDFKISLFQASVAFPVVVYTHKLGNNERKIMDISECIADENGGIKYNTLFRYKIRKNEIKNGERKISGHFEMVNPISDSLKERLIQFGAGEKTIQPFIKECEEKEREKL